MGDWRIVRYNESRCREWDEFVAASRNATFLFRRGYMDYHSDRFRDCSWMAYKGNRLLAVLPANIDESGILHSHQGLTYGGWVLPQAHLDGADLMSIFSEACNVWREEGISQLIYKPLPFIYATRPSQEDEYALFRLGAQRIETNLSAAIDLRVGAKFNKLQRRHLSQASELNMEISECDNIPLFMEMLAECLAERHDTKPVHTAAEMQLLKSRFPDNIRFFTASIAGVPDAGVCVYDSQGVAHAQYIATTPKGRELNLLTPLFDYLINKEFADRRYFDFGISNENHGLVLNEGLLRQKYSYGATGVAYQKFIISL